MPVMLRATPRRILSINAVDEEHQLGVLEALGVAASYDDGSLVCAVCGEPVKNVGLGVARRQGETIAFSCARLDCMRALS
jgi:hypothetical protein